MNRKQIITLALVLCAAVLAAAVAMGVGDIFQAAGFTYADAEKYTVGEAEITETVKNLEIGWINGKVSLEYHSGSTIELREKSNRTISADMQMRWLLDGDTLKIQYAKSGFRLGRNQEKELTVLLPEGIVFGHVNISATSGDLNIPSLQVETLNLAATSGGIRAAAEAATVSAGTTSGDIRRRID